MNEEIEYGIYRAAIAKWGKNAQEDMVLEELSELTKAILKFRRNINVGSGYEERQNLKEEIVDVEIMLKQLKIIYALSEHELANLKEIKLVRLLEAVRK